MRRPVILQACGIVMAITAAGAPAFAAEPPVGTWQNTRTDTVLDFSADGQLRMNAAPPVRYAMCGLNGGNICVTGEGFTCHYRASFNGKTMQLQLFTGRPTKFCPEGVFRPK